MDEERWGLLIDDQPLQRGAHQRRAARAASCCATDGRIVCVSSISGIAGNAGQTNYATSKAGRDRHGPVAGAGARRARARRSTRSRPGFIETQMTAAMPIAAARGGPADELAVAGRACRSTSPRRSPGSRARPRPASTATSSASAARACSGRDEPIATHAHAYARAAGCRCVPGRLAAAVRGGRRRRDARARAALRRTSSADPDALADYAAVCGFRLRDDAARRPTRTCSPSRCTWS